MALFTKTTIVNLLALLLALSSAGFCLFGILIAFSFPLGNVHVESVDTTIFTPELSILAGLCMWIPAFITAAAALGLWFGFGRAPLQRQLIQVQLELDNLREMTLQTYLDQIGTLMIEADPTHNIPHTELVQFLQRRTHETLAVLDAPRQRQLLQFLKGAQLIGEEGLIQLEQTNWPQTE